jgi:hypothetical protein
MRKPIVVNRKKMISDFQHLYKQWRTIKVEGPQKTQAIHMLTKVSDCLEYLIEMGSVSKILWVRIVKFYNRA